MKKTRVLIGALALSCLITVPAYAAEWKQDAKGWWWQEDNGSYPASTWKNIGGKSYYFGADGYMLANTTTPDGYKVGPDGAWIEETQSKQQTLISAPTNDKWLPFGFSINSADGLKLCWLANNNSGKTINYYTAKVYFYDPVGNPAYDEITHLNYDTVKYVGPVEPGGEMAIYTIVGYLGACEKITIGEITLEYADGTSETVWYGKDAYCTD